MEIARHWRLQGERLRLEGGRCDACGALAFPRRPRCASCGDTRQSAHRFRGEGEIWSVCEVVQAPRGFEAQVPYLCALVKLDEGPMVLAQLTDVDAADAKIGLRVEAVTRRIRESGADGLILYGYKFRPRLARGT
jgi:hypothetical protein